MHLNTTQQRALDTLDPAQYRRLHTSKPPAPSDIARAIAEAAEWEEQREAELQEQWEAEERATAERTHLRAA